MRTLFTNYHMCLNRKSIFNTRKHPSFSFSHRSAYKQAPKAYKKFLLNVNKTKTILWNRNFFFDTWISHYIMCIYVHFKWKFHNFKGNFLKYKANWWWKNRKSFPHIKLGLKFYLIIIIELFTQKKIDWIVHLLINNV